MDNRELRGLVNRVRSGRMSRRGFIRRMAAVGLTAPMCTQLLALGGVAHAAPAAAYKPTKAGGGGTLKTLWWQGPTLLNPHFATGTKDSDGSRVFYEPLAAWDTDGNLVPVLAAELPTVANGGLAEDGRFVIWKLKQGVKWHDGESFTADDCVFNWQYCKDPATAAVTIGSYQDITVEKVDDYSVKVTFPKPQPFWADAFVAVNGMIIPKHLFQDYMGSKSRDAPTNLKPVGTGPYVFDSFTPGDLLTGKMNPRYHVPNQPYFDAIQMKGGGDAVSAARAVLQTGEYDFAWNLQVEDEILKRIEAGGKGRVLVVVGGGNIEHIQCNFSDPSTTVDDQRSSIKTKHPTLQYPEVRQALALCVNRDAVQQYIYGRTGEATDDYINDPKQFRSSNMKGEFNVQKAADLLEKAGWKAGADGVLAEIAVIGGLMRAACRTRRPRFGLAAATARSEVLDPGIRGGDKNRLIHRTFFVIPAKAGIIVAGRPGAPETREAAAPARPKLHENFVGHRSAVGPIDGSCAPEGVRFLFEFKKSRESRCGFGASRLFRYSNDIIRSPSHDCTGREPSSARGGRLRSSPSMPGAASSRRAWEARCRARAPHRCRSSANPPTHPIPPAFPARARR